MPCLPWQKQGTYSQGGYSVASQPPASSITPILRDALICLGSVTWRVDSLIQLPSCRCKRAPSNALMTPRVDSQG
ncbi:hypothetical protein BO70DRAFT_359517 [Aspergillus heteromorphus CBS 117.55]|uniref:Uncharacterized protein n=1 Tax=Aspergillus heteromorphus CBS 117.55 TaxID=1448321 RepID=A0A317WVB4_9EURO|nr:uncharacterized protein BO70DRAFT_359517 [Aspergillus heteromorphus CBS 117.55]PWY89242.1 hypothetical protein BO70DRAFT_359517 [Aspergillus heteromorphus CBS 117.55]